MERTSSDSERETRTFLRRVASSGIWNVFSYIASSAGVFVVGIVVARATGPRGFGTFSFYWWLLRIVATFLSLGLPAVLARYVPEYLGAGDTGAARRTWGAVKRFAVVLMTLAFAATTGFLISRGETLLIAAGVGVGAAVALFSRVTEGFLQGLRQFAKIAKIVGLATAVQVALIAAGAAMGLSAGELAALFAVSGLMQLAILQGFARSAQKGWSPGRLTKERSSRMVRFGATLAVIAVIDEIVFGRPEVFFLEAFRGREEVGFYNVGLKFASLVVLLPTVMSRSLLPEFSFLKGGKRDEEFAQVFPLLCRTIALIAAAMAFIGAAFSDLLVAVFYGEDFGPAVFPTAVLLAGSIVGGVAGPVAAAMFADSREKYFMQAGLVMVTFNLALDFILIPRYGLKGAAVATITSQTIAIGIGFVLAIRKVRLPYPVADVLKIGLVAIVCGVAGRAAVQTLPVVPAFFIGGFTSGLVYLFLVDRLGLVKLSRFKHAILKRNTP